jgi:hypothetical protein
VIEIPARVLVASLFDEGGGGRLAGRSGQPEQQAAEIAVGLGLFVVGVNRVVGGFAALERPPRGPIDRSSGRPREKERLLAARSGPIDPPHPVSGVMRHSLVPPLQEFLPSRPRFPETVSCTAEPG